MKINYDNILISLFQSIKDKREAGLEKFNFESVANSTVNVGFLDNKKINRAIFYLRSKGCKWSCTKYGGCFMCGHYSGTSMGRNIPDRAFVNQFIKEYTKYDFTNIPMVCLYNAGSILNKDEIPNKELLEILHIISTNKHIKRVVLESRPEFINMELLTEISKICKDKIIEIGIGLETSNDKIRDKCINKGFDFSAYLEAVNVIKKFGNIKVLTYITVKPLFLGINESITDVVESVNQISYITDIISLEPLSIQKYTLIEYMYNKKIYHIPTGWMIRDIVMGISDLLLLDQFELRIGGFEFYPIPEKFMMNCKECNHRLYEAIDYFNSYKELNKLSRLNCQCYNDYLMAKQSDREYVESIPVEERICNIMNSLFKQLLT